MKKIKNIVLSLLLFSFGFIVLHDYAMEIFEPQLQHEISCANKGSAAHANAIVIHDCIHMLVAFSQPKPQLCFLENLNSRPLYSKLQPSSHIRHVLERPPLS